MLWTRSDTIGLAKPSCAQCHGYGLRISEMLKRENPCNCVLRAIFRACYARFRECVMKEKRMSRVSLEFYRGGKDAYRSYARKTEDYLADFCLVSRRALTEQEYDIFRYFFLLGANWRMCCARLGMDRGNFFHAVYRIEQKLGRTFRELEPYGLYPLDEYFGGKIYKHRPQPSRAENVREMPRRQDRRRAGIRKSA
jgi:hypothetical protein